MDFNELEFEIWASVNEHVMYLLLQKMTHAQLEQVSMKFGFPLRGNKSERINSLIGYFKAPSTWNAISNWKYNPIDGDGASLEN